MDKRSSSYLDGIHSDISVLLATETTLQDERTTSLVIRQLDLFDLDGGFSYSSCNSLGTPQRSLCTSDAIPYAHLLQQNDKHTRKTTKIREPVGKSFICN